LGPISLKAVLTAPIFSPLAAAGSAAAKRADARAVLRILGKRLASKNMAEKRVKALQDSARCR
jgi:hypothetical protein